MALTLLLFTGLEWGLPRVTCNVTLLRTAREGAPYVPRSGGVRASGCSAVTSPVVDLLVFNEMVSTCLVEGAS